jgi:hypothetical protein
MRSFKSVFISLAITPLMAVIGCYDKKPEAQAMPNPAESREYESAWKAECSIENSTFKISFRSPTEDVTNDDMTAVIHWQDGTNTPIQLTPGWFMPDLKMTSDIPNTCKRIVGHNLADHRVLLWLARNGRPNNDQLVLVLLDISNKKVLDIQNNIGEIDPTLLLVKHSTDRSILLDRYWSQDPTNGGEFGVPEWMNVLIKNDRIITQWRYSSEKQIGGENGRQIMK